MASIIGAAIALMTEGEEPTMRAVARFVGISERTVFRYFANHETLMMACLPALAQRISAPRPDHVSGLPAYVETLYARFAEHEQLVHALAHAAWAAPLLEQTRRGHYRALCDLLAADFPRATTETVEAAAANLRVVVSGAGYVHLRACGLTPEQSLASALWLLDRALHALATPPHPPVDEEVSP